MTEKNNEIYSEIYPNLEKMCRLCLKPNSGEVNVFDEDGLILRIMTCTAIEIKPTDSFSKLLCEKCRNDLEKSYFFRKRSQIYDNKLKKHLRLINSGRRSSVFDKSNEDEDDEIFELEDSIKFINQIENMQNVKINRELNLLKLQNENIEKALQISQEKLKEKQKEEIDFRKNYNNLQNEYKENMQKLKEEYEQKIKCLEESHVKIMDKCIEEMKSNLRKDEENRLLNEIKEFIEIRLKTNNYKNKEILIENFEEVSTSNLIKKRNLNKNSIINQTFESQIETEEDRKIQQNDYSKLIKINLKEKDEDAENVVLIEDETLVFDNENNNGNDKDILTHQEISNSSMKENNIEIIDEIEFDMGIDEEEEIDENEQDIEMENSNDEENINFTLTKKKYNIVKITNEQKPNRRGTDDSKNSLEDSEKCVKKLIHDTVNDKNINGEENLKFNVENISEDLTQIKVQAENGDEYVIDFQSIKPLLNENGSNEEKIDVGNSRLTNQNSGIGDQVKIFRCNLCTQAFSREGQLMKHLSGHLSKRGYTCPICKKFFACKSSLTRHLRIHTGEKPFVCPHCNRSFIQNEVLKRHLSIHTDERPYKCKDCSKSFIQKTLLRQHVNQKHSKNQIKKIHECRLCPKTFMHASGLSRHLLAHSGVINNCNVCQKEFSDKSALKRHLVSIHNIGRIEKNKGKSD